MSRLPVVAVAAALVAVACSGGDDADVVGTTATMAPDLTEPTTAVSEVVATPAPLPTIEPPATTSAPVDTTDPTPATTEPPAPSTTERVLTAEELAVIEAARASTTAWIEVLRDPWDEELIQAAALTRTGPALDRLVNGLAQLRTDGIRGGVHPEIEATITMYEQTVRLDGPDRATVEYCHVDSDLTIEVGTAPDGGDVILEDIVIAKHQQAVMVKIDGRWLDETGTELARFEGATECDV